jgi:hypothetical protein
MSSLPTFLRGVLNSACGGSGGNRKILVASGAARYKLDGDGADGSFAPLDVSKEYLTQSYKRYVRQRVTNWVVGLAVAAVFGAIATAIPVNNIKWEKTALEKARYETAAARGNDLLDNEDPHLALLLALEFIRSKGQKNVNGWAIEGLAYKALEFLLPKKVYDSLLPTEVDDRSIEALAYKALQTPQPKAILLTEAPFPTATFSPDGRFLLISKGNAFQLWDTDKITPVGEEFIPKDIDARWRTIWSHDAQWLIGSNANKESMLFRPCSVDKLREYFQRCDNDVDFIRTIHVGDDTASWPSVLSPAGDKLLSGGMGVAPKIWDIEASWVKPLSRPEPDPQGPAGLAIAFNQGGICSPWAASTDQSEYIKRLTRLNYLASFAFDREIRLPQSTQWHSTLEKVKTMNSFPQHWTDASDYGA